MSMTTMSLTSYRRQPSTPSGRTGWLCGYTSKRCMAWWWGRAILPSCTSSYTRGADLLFTTQGEQNLVMPPSAQAWMAPECPSVPQVVTEAPLDSSSYVPSTDRGVHGNSGGSPGDLAHGSFGVWRGSFGGWRACGLPGPGRARAALVGGSWLALGCAGGSVVQVGQILEDLGVELHRAGGARPVDNHLG